GRGRSRGRRDDRPEHRERRRARGAARGGTRHRPADPRAPREERTLHLGGRTARGLRDRAGHPRGTPRAGHRMTRSDLRLLPGATCVWALAVLGVTAGTAAAVAGAAVLVALALSVITLAGPRRTGHALFAHLGIVVLAGVLLFPALQRHGQTDDALERAAAEGLVV